MGLSFTFPVPGPPALLLAPLRYQLVGAGKRGLVSVWDLRQQRQVHFFKAHDQAIKCLAMDPGEEFFVTGSVAGDIKVNAAPIKCDKYGLNIVNAVHAKYSGLVNQEEWSCLPAFLNGFLLMKLK